MKLELYHRDAMTGDEIKAIRKFLGMSQTVFADSLGVSRATIVRWEKDGDPPVWGFRAIRHLMDNPPKAGDGDTK